MKSVYLFLLLWFCTSTAQGSRQRDEEQVVRRPEGEDTRRARLRADLCKKKRCQRGEICYLTASDEATCACNDNCKEEEDVRYHVCSSKNTTYKSECLLDLDHCRCKNKFRDCSNLDLNKIQLDYYGQCKELTECPEHEFEEFPSRMKDWLFIVMQQLASRDALGQYINLLDKAKNDANHTEAVLWKFCDLDSSPKDRHVSRRELQYIVQSLKAWEHCLVPFLSKCDSDSDRKITLKEWGSCLGVEADKIEDRCIDIRSRARRH